MTKDEEQTMLVINGVREDFNMSGLCPYQLFNSAPVNGTPCDEEQYAELPTSDLPPKLCEACWKPYWSLLKFYKQPEMERGK